MWSRRVSVQKVGRSGDFIDGRTHRRANCDRQILKANISNNAQSVPTRVLHQTIGVGNVSSTSETVRFLKLKTRLKTLITAYSNQELQKSNISNHAQSVPTWVLHQTIGVGTMGANIVQIRLVGFGTQYNVIQIDICWGGWEIWET